MLSASDLGMNYESMTLLINGRPMLSDSATLTSSGVKDGDVIQVKNHIQTTVKTIYSSYGCKSESVLTSFDQVIQASLGYKSNWLHPVIYYVRM